MMGEARFISLEGSEGAGKSTLARALAEWLGTQGRRVVLTREPGGTAAGEQLRGVLLAHGDEELSPVAETLLMFAARALHIDNLIRPALLRGDWVICDRFTDASYAYQGGGRGVPALLLDHLAADVQAGLWPDRTLLLDLPVEVGLARARRRGAGQDRFEGESRQFFERVRRSYLQRAQVEPQRFSVLNAALPADALLAAAQAALADLLDA